MRDLLEFRRRWPGVRNDIAKLFAESPDEDQAGRVAVVVPVAMVVQVERPRVVDHRLHKGFFALFRLVFRIGGCGGGPALLLHAGKDLIHALVVKTRVGEVDVRHDRAEERFGFVQAGFQGFDVLRGRVSASCGGLIVCTFYAEERQQ